MNEAPRIDAPVASSNGLRTWLSLALLLLTLGGIGMLQFQSQYATTYWLVMVPLFGIVNAIAAWRPLQTQGLKSGEIVRRMVLHWGGLALSLGVVFLVMDDTGLGSEVAAMIAASLLALTCFLAGVHFDWHFMVLGLVLGLTVAGGAMLEQYFWFALVVAVVAGVVIAVLRRRQSA